MNDFSDLIFLIGAIAIYGLLVTNTNRTLLLNSQILTNSEIEYGAISTAQNILDEARWQKYDELDEDELEALYDKELYYDDVSINPLSSGDCPTDGNCKEIVVTITSNYLTNDDGTPRKIKLSLIKTDY